MHPLFLIPTTETGEGSPLKVSPTRGVVPVSMTEEDQKVSEQSHRVQDSSSAAPGAPERMARDEQPSFRLGHSYIEGELVIGLIGPVGTDFEAVVKDLKDWLETAQYQVQEIRVSKDIIRPLIPRTGTHSGEFQRISWGMEDGDTARRRSGDSSILAVGAASKIASLRPADEKGNAFPAPRRAYIINSLKNPAEVFRLREIYPLGFYAIGINSDESYRRRVLTELRAKKMSEREAEELIKRDYEEDEDWEWGQRVRDTFHLSDFFVRLVDENLRVRNELARILELLFGEPYKTPTFDEYAMFLAFASSLRSADMSRQVGAVIAKDGEIISTGANDCPAFGGGLYWPEYNPSTKKVEDAPDGRDYKRGEDLNKAEQQEIINQILQRAEKIGIDKDQLNPILQASRITDLTEFGRAVHAEMEALLSCARRGVTTKGAVLYCTTFPCHNCAKHIIAAGIKRVVFIEPYEKSQAEKLHSEAMKVGFFDGSVGQTEVHFEPFIGVGPRRFLDLFSMRVGAGSELIREDESSHIKDWKSEDSTLRIQMMPLSYLETERAAVTLFKQQRKKVLENQNGTRGNNHGGPGAS